MHHFEIFDRPGWNCFTYTFPHWGGIEKRPGGRVVIRFDSADASTYNDDFFFQHYEEVALCSDDGCRTWQRFEPDWSHLVPLHLSDGTRIEIVEARDLISRSAQRQRLEDLGIGHLWRDDCRLAWDLWPRRMLDELKAQGLLVFDQEGSWLPEDVVATHAPSGFVVRRCESGGDIWTEHAVAGLEPFYHLGPCFPGSVVLDDDTILFPFYAMRRRDEPPTRFTLMGAEIHVLRSRDGGRTFEMIMIGGNVPDTHMSEVSLVAHPSGRIVAMIRNPEIFCSISDDFGTTWSLPRPTGIRDTIPMDAFCLEDGTMELLLEDRIFARYITALGYITPKQAQECLRLQTRILEKGHRKVRFVDVLVARKYLTKDQVIRARQTFC